MKKRFYLAAFAAMALMSCNEKTVNVQEMPEQAGTVELKVKVPAASTRLTGEAADEDKISNLQVFVFNESDALEAYGNEDAESLSLTCVPGKKQVVALVNAPSLSDISKLSDLQAEVSYLSDNEAGALVMASDLLDKELLAEGDNTMAIQVTRLAAKVILGSVTNAMALESDQSKEFVINAVYLINVADDARYIADHDPASWYNKMKYQEDNCLDFLYDVVGQDLPYEEEYSAQHYFYCYPNPTEDDVQGGTDWSPRLTRLVVEAELGGVLCYYPLTLPIVERNTEYIINLTVTRIGSSNPDIPVTTGEALFTVTVKDWEDGGERNETI